MAAESAIMQWAIAKLVHNYFDAITQQKGDQRRITINASEMQRSRSVKVFLVYVGVVLLGL